MQFYDDFAGRVRLAASYISQGRESTRRFCGCFEMWDGDFVALALYRRILANPDSALAKNFDRYLTRDSVALVAERHAAVPTRDLPRLAAEERARAEAQYAT